MAWEFLRPVLTANALATVQANPILLAYFLAWFTVILSIGFVAWYIHFETNKAYKKPKKPDANKKTWIPSLPTPKLPSFLKK